MASSLVVHGGDGGLELVLADLPLAQSHCDERHPLADEFPVPLRAVLLGQRNELAAGAGAGRAPGVGEQHQGEQAGHLGVVGQGGVHAPGQAHGLAREV